VSERWRIVTDDWYCGSSYCRRIVVQRGDKFISKIGTMPRVMDEIRAATGQRYFRGGPAAREASRRFWTQRWLKGYPR